MNASRLYILIDRIAALLCAEQRQLGLDAGLQPVHIQLLSYLHHCNRFSNTPAAATRYIGLTKGTVSQSLLWLENKGFISKQADANDRRVVHLCLTELGLNAQLSGEHSALWQQACSSALTNAQLPTITAHLENILRGLQQAHGGRTFGICHTCKYFLSKKNGFICGLTSEPLQADEAELICHEHAFATSTATKE